MNYKRKTLLIIGGSYAACEIASHARKNGYGEDVIIVSEEPELPYHRPPLSKTFIKSPSEDGLSIKNAAFYSANKIDLELGTKVVGFGPGERTALLSNGKSIAFDALALAVGARPRTLICAGADPTNVHYLRSIADARALSAATAKAENIVVIGAGFIGLEIASTLRAPQQHVTVIETENRVLARAVSPEISEFLGSVHIGHGIKLLTSRKVQSLVEENGTVRKVMLTDGTAICADVVIVGIGSVANLELPQALGLDIDNGVLVDPLSRTSRENIFAAGDCTRFRSKFNLEGARLESVQNAIDQSRAAGAAIAGQSKAYEAIPWFWSDQFDFKLQIVGIPVGATERILRPGANSSLSVFHFRNDLCVCVESVNQPREHVGARQLLNRKNISMRDLEDVDFNISALLKTS
ncbi:FAD-dependent oxidoreductase [Mesorhizobium sp. M0520]|uniref:NAD(P)/FAD-dependent oxidoreductase n=1 Tax=Mesorhizobium sp. M0520 TaxID=2956957 RepID=UPI003335D32C